MEVLFLTILGIFVFVPALFVMILFYDVMGMQWLRDFIANLCGYTDHNTEDMFYFIHAAIFYIVAAGIGFGVWALIKWLR